MELGSGIGFTGIAICKTCNPKTYIFSDHHHGVLQQLAENICLNGFVLESETTQRIQTETGGQEAEATNYQNPKLVVAELDWGSVTGKQLLDLQPDVIIAAGTLRLCFMSHCVLSCTSIQVREIKETDTNLFLELAYV